MNGRNVDGLRRRHESFQDWLERRFDASRYARYMSIVGRSRLAGMPHRKVRVGNKHVWAVNAARHLRGEGK